MYLLNPDVPYIYVYVKLGNVASEVVLVLSRGNGEGCNDTWVHGHPLTVYY